MVSTTEQRKVAIVTGGGSGISLALVKLLLNKGYNVSIFDLNIGAAKELVEESES
jgi:NAD(P)-dependent dehydrogenase (short-subunit alcohol dehydrogenase family)